MNESRNIIHGSFVDILGNLRYAVGTSMDKEEEHTPPKGCIKNTWIYLQQRIPRISQTYNLLIISNNNHL